MAEINEIIGGQGQTLEQMRQALMQTQGQLAALTDAHADLHNNVMPPEQIEPPQVPAAEGQQALSPTPSA